MNGIARLHPHLQHAIVNDLCWRSLRPVQDLTIAAVLDGCNAVVLAPTAGGKTEAAIFPILSRILSENLRPVAALYVCPIRALLNNQEERLRSYAKMVGLDVFKWHGDVNDARKQRFQEDPAHILMTTPESLEVMLMSARTDARALFMGLSAIIVDEVHAFAADDRGAHLASLLERLASMTKSNAKKPRENGPDEIGNFFPWQGFDRAQSQWQTLAYLKALTGAKTMAEAATEQMFWRLIRPDPTGGRSNHQSLVGSYRELRAQLLGKNLTGGYGVYVMANITDFHDLYVDEYHGVHCNEADVLAIRSLYADFDQKLLDEPLDLHRICKEAPIHPSFATWTGGGLHVYWRLRNPKAMLSDEERVQSKGMLLSLAKVMAKHGADPQFVSLAQCPRVPGFLNTKPGRWPLPMVRMADLPTEEEMGMAVCDFRTLSRIFPPPPETRSWLLSFKVQDATGYSIESAPEQVLDRAYEVLEEYEGGARDSGFGCSSQIMSAAGRLLRMGLHPDAVEELIEEEINQYIDPPYEDVGRKVGDAWRRFKQLDAQQMALEAELDAELGLDEDEE